MKLAKSLVIAIVTLCMPLICAAQITIALGNSDGTFTSNAGETVLSLTGSELTSATGLGTGFNCGVTGSPLCAGTLTLTSGVLQSTVNSSMTSVTPTLLPTTGEVSTLVGGTLTVTETAGGSGGELNGFTFSGTFSTESWSCLTGSTCAVATKGANKGEMVGTWVFNGTISGGTVTINGQSLMIESGGTVQLTTSNGAVTKSKTGVLTIKASGGNTSIVSPVPEPGTLSLFGSGLIGLGLVARRRFSKQGTGKS